jgi:hypothetical protein
VVTDYPLNNISEGGVFNNHSYMWQPMPTPNTSAQGAGGPILPALVNVVYTTPQTSFGQNLLSGSVIVALLMAIGATWYLN